MTAYQLLSARMDIVERELRDLGDTLKHPVCCADPRDDAWVTGRMWGALYAYRLEYVDLADAIATLWEAGR